MNFDEKHLLLGRPSLHQRGKMRKCKLCVGRIGPRVVVAARAIAAAAAYIV